VSDLDKKQVSLRAIQEKIFVRLDEELENIAWNSGTVRVGPDRTPQAVENLTDEAVEFFVAGLSSLASALGGWIEGLADMHQGSPFDLVIQECTGALAECMYRRHGAMQVFPRLRTANQWLSDLRQYRVHARRHYSEAIKAGTAAELAAARERMRDYSLKILRIEQAARKSDVEAVRERVRMEAASARKLVFPLRDILTNEWERRVRS
jgi:hypothetical protein